MPVKFNNQTKNPAYGRQRISQPMRIGGLIQFLKGCMIYLKKKKFKGAIDVSISRVHASTPTRVHTTAPRMGDGRSAPTPRF